MNPELNTRPEPYRSTEDDLYIAASDLDRQQERLNHVSPVFAMPYGPSRPFNTGILGFNWYRFSTQTEIEKKRKAILSVAIREIILRDTRSHRVAAQDQANCGLYEPLVLSISENGSRHHRSGWVSYDQYANWMVNGLASFSYKEEVKLERRFIVKYAMDYLERHLQAVNREKYGPPIRGAVHD